MRQLNDNTSEQVIDIVYEAGLFSSRIEFSDAKENKYQIGYNTYGITLDRNGSNIFRGHPYLDCYFHNELGERGETTQKIPDELNFPKVGCLKLPAEYRKGKLKLREVILNGQLIALIEYESRLFRPPNKYTVRLLLTDTLSVDLALFSFAYIHNRIVGRNSS